MTTARLNWSRDFICLRSADMQAHDIARIAYNLTCRTNFDAPGFCVVNVGGSIGSVGFRQLMVDVKREMAAIHMAISGDFLVYLSAARFDQQESTKPHLDAGPEQCFLMLGYEPSEVLSELEITDYTKCAFELGLTPKEFMVQYNPMFKAGYELLRPYTTRIPCFSPSDFQIVCVNNSSAPFSSDGSTWQGTLHTATILNPDESKRRVINSTMIARALSECDEVVDKAALEYFIHTTEVKRRRYDKLHLEDDK